MSHTDVGRARVEASPSEAFAALVDADARTAWLPPAGMSGEFSWFDARPGGGYRLTLTYDDVATRGKSVGNADVVEVRFTAVEAPRHVVEEADFVSDDPNLAGTMTMTWSLEPVDRGTLVTITATEVPDGVSSEDHVTAFASTLGNLDRYLRDVRADDRDVPAARHHVGGPTSRGRSFTSVGGSHEETGRGNVEVGGDPAALRSRRT